jgi:hypothetical protein
VENIYAQVDAEGRRYMLMDAIIDHRKDENAAPKDDAYVVVNGKKNRQKTTDWWHLNKTFVQEKNNNEDVDRSEVQCNRILQGFNY